jgi:sugar phosphate isomerase/epimerase
MRLGVISDGVSQNPDHAFRFIKRLGATCVDIRDVWGRNVAALNDSEVSELKRLAERHGLEISNVDSYAFKVYIDDEQGIASSLNTLRRAIEITKKLDLNLTRIFTFWWQDGLEGHRERVIELLAPALDLGSQEGVTLSVENEYSCMVGTGKETARLLEIVGSRWLKVLWDPGNAFFARENPYPEGFNYVKDNIVHVHLKDACVENGSFKFKPIGAGKINYQGQLKDLYRSFVGVVSLETHYTPEGWTREEGTAASFKGLLKILTEIEDQLPD